MTTARSMAACTALRANSTPSAAITMIGARNQNVTTAQASLSVRTVPWEPVSPPERKLPR